MQIATHRTLALGHPWEAVRSRLHHQWQTHAHIWSFLVAIVLLGLIFGGVVAGIISNNDKLVISNALTNLLSTLSQGQMASGASLWTDRMVSDGRFLIILWILGLSIVGLPLVAVALFLRAFSVGFSIGFTVLTFGWHGVLFSVAGIFAHQLLSFSALILAGGVAIRFSATLLRQSHPLPQLIRRVIAYTLAFSVFMVPLATGALMQAYWSPGLMASILAHTA